MTGRPVVDNQPLDRRTAGFWGRLWNKAKHDQRADDWIVKPFFNTGVVVCAVILLWVIVLAAMMGLSGCILTTRSADRVSKARHDTWLEAARVAADKTRDRDDLESHFRGEADQIESSPEWMRGKR